MLERVGDKLPSWGFDFTLAMMVTQANDIGDGLELHNAIERAAATNPAKLRDTNAIKSKIAEALMNSQQ